ncbi:glutathione S-transferase family protein [Pontitalea aquivivens]|uniref:glutathione S-transferase family protein n=1 Tax=Pontitalea aquivivens TaxID=3388663 RepID=UPI003970D83E
MIELYCATTPNVLKVEIMLEEVGEAYVLRPLDVWKGDQFSPEFRRLNPIAKVPVIVDRDEEGNALPVFESAAILMYLAEKHGRFLPSAGRARTECLQWLVFQAANQGPASGQLVHFQRYAGSGHDYSLNRYKNQAAEVWTVLEQRLSQTAFIGGSEYSIADMASLTWVISLSNLFGEQLPFFAIESDRHPALSAWAAACKERAAIKRALAMHATIRSGLPAATEMDKDRFFRRGDFSQNL